MTIDTIINPAPPTPTQTAAAFNAVAAISEAIRELGSVPSGELYARVASHLDLKSYQAIIDLLKRCDLVRESKARMLTWIGPELDARIPQCK